MHRLMKKINKNNSASILIFSLLTFNANADIEDWYTFWSFGLADHQYKEPVRSKVNQVEALPGVSRMEIALDMAGLYVPVGEKGNTIAGFVINASSDRLHNSLDHIQLKQYLYGVSMMHFFGREPGDGWFLRGDIGTLRLRLSASRDISLADNNGSGYVVGIGYGIPVSPESRIIFSLTSASRSVKHDEFNNSIAFNIGGLW